MRKPTPAEIRKLGKAVVIGARKRSNDHLAEIDALQDDIEDEREGIDIAEHAGCIGLLAERGATIKAATFFFAADDDVQDLVEEAAPALVKMFRMRWPDGMKGER